MDLLTISRFYRHHATLRLPDVHIVLYHRTGMGITEGYPRCIAAFIASADNSLIAVIEADDTDITIDDAQASHIDRVLLQLCSV